MSIETAAATDIGRERDHNEDAVYTGTVGGKTVLAVADGMGGHRAGDVASEEALETFVTHLDSQDLDSVTAGTDLEEALVAATRAANTHLNELAAEDTQFKGMGTTLVAALFDDGVARLVNVGDSRGYHVVVDGIEQVTTDQSLVQELVEKGTIEPEEADDHPQKNVLSQALGTAETVEPDTHQLAVEGTLLLCSDGLSDEVADAEIQQIVTTADSIERAAGRLIGRANEVDGGDNISVVLGRTVTGD
jgi:serine/threonine protein phosphatase PrpC